MADKTIKDVVKQLEDTNKLLQETLQKDDALLSLQDSSGIVGKIARQMERNAEKEREKQAEDGKRRTKTVAVGLAYSPLFQTYRDQ